MESNILPALLLLAFVFFCAYICRDLLGQLWEVNADFIGLSWTIFACLGLESVFSLYIFRFTENFLEILGRQSVVALAHPFSEFAQLATLLGLVTDTRDEIDLVRKLVGNTNYRLTSDFYDIFARISILHFFAKMEKLVTLAL